MLPGFAGWLPAQVCDNVGSGVTPDPDCHGRISQELLARLRNSGFRDKRLNRGGVTPDYFYLLRAHHFEMLVHPSPVNLRFKIVLLRARHFAERAA